MGYRIEDAAVKTILSLRARIFIGAVFWMAALFIAAGMVLTHLINQNPRAPVPVPSALPCTWTSSASLIVLCLGVGLLLVRRGLNSFDVLRIRLAEVKEGRDAAARRRVPLRGPAADQRSQQPARRSRAARDARADESRRSRARVEDPADDSQSAGGTAPRRRARRNWPLRSRSKSSGCAGRWTITSRTRAHRLQAATAGARCHVLTSADALARTMMTLHADRQLAIDVHVSHEHFVRVQREDLEEMLGNLVDNACKWAKSRVEVRSRIVDGRIEITVDDDGPGLDPSLRETVLQRGVRADEAAPGSGLGLAIVRDLVELYGGSIALGTSPLGGLRATLLLPAS